MWLKVNKLSLNIKKTKLMIFHQPSKKVNKPKLQIEHVPIECVDNFNLLGITINKNMNWKPHIDKIANKISRSIGILNKLKHYLPLKVKITIYNSLIVSHLNYGILAWGKHSDRLFKQQKKAISIITTSNYNAHTEPLFKSLKLLKLKDSFDLFQLKLFYKFVTNHLPDYFQAMPFISNTNMHGYNLNTRQQNNIYIGRVRHEFAKSCIRQTIPKLLNSTPTIVTDKLYTHSYQGFTNYAKNYYLQNYQDTCNISRCYICKNM
jgi:hypothetical protein